MKRRIEKKTSRTAEMTCVLRAASYFETNQNYKSNDFIAPLLVPALIKSLLKSGFIRNLYRGRFAPKGIYEYVIARTKLIDLVYERALKQDFEQILIFGAGFDSRAIRFDRVNKKTKVFELDAYHTQAAKLKQLNKRGIKIPANTIYIPIDFNKEKIRDKLIEYTFLERKKMSFYFRGVAYVS